MRDIFIAHLTEGAGKMDVALDDVQLERFWQYYCLLTEANAKFNLTRVSSDPVEFIDRNLLDCLTPVKHIVKYGAETLIDVGTGAGFPGVPLAIALPHVRVTLLDALDKRVQFLHEVISSLQLNATAVHQRAEDAARREELREAFDIATARAVAPVNVLCEYLLPFVRVGGQMIALKGPNLAGELSEGLAAIETLGGTNARAVSAVIPNRDWQHGLLLVDKAQLTPDKYPRRAGMPEKRPLR